MDGLTDREAFDAMSLFLVQYAERAGDGLLTLLGDVSVLDDGQPTDPAARTDWLACVAQFKGRRAS